MIHIFKAKISQKTIAKLIRDYLKCNLKRV